MIWDRVTILRAIFPSRATAGEVARRWRAAATRERELAADVIRMGGLLTLQPIENGAPDLSNPQRLAYEAGRRDLALQLLAMMNLSLDEMNTLMEDNDV